METERILIVDDEETLCEVLKLNLENEGYDVDIAFSAEQALTYNLEVYSLILLDIMMGEISGIKMAKMVKNNVKTAKIPIIFCTALEVVRGSARLRYWYCRTHFHCYQKRQEHSS